MVDKPDHAMSALFGKTFPFGFPQAFLKRVHQTLTHLPMSPPPDPTTKRELFGGAITCEFPTRLVDVSDFRPVPDNQEVWTDADRDESVIVELLDRVEVGPSDDVGAAKWFFDDLAEVNDASVSSGLSTIEEVRILTKTEVPNLNGSFEHASLAVGTSSIAKGRVGTDKRNQVRVAIVNVRLSQVGTDLLITINRATTIAEGSSADAPEAGDKEISAANALTQITNSLKIENWSLFG